MKNKLFFLLLPTILFSQTKIGNSIDDVKGLFGSGISISNDGNILALGAPKFKLDNSGEKDDAGIVIVYKWQFNRWDRIGISLKGENNDEYFGESISLSANGEILAVGAPSFNAISNANGYVKIYKKDGTSYKQIGQTLIGDNIVDTFGTKVSISANGKRLAISAPRSTINGTEYGSVKIFNFDETTSIWEQLGQTIVGDNIEDKFGSSLALSSDGTTVIIGTPSSDIGKRDSGQVKIYQLNASNTWIQLGNTINGTQEFERFATSVAINGNGTKIVIGAPRYSNTVVNPYIGKVDVYELEQENWIYKLIIRGEAIRDEFGEDVSINDKGNVIAVVAPLNDNGGENTSNVRIFKQSESGVWAQAGNSINGTNPFDIYTKVALSGDGNIVLLGLPYANYNGTRTGVAEVYDLTAVLSTESFQQDYFSFYPNPVKENLNITLKQGFTLEKVNIYNTLSQFLYSVNTSKVDVSKLATGIYFIEVVTNQGKSAKKIIVE